MKYIVPIAFLWSLCYNGNTAGIVPNRLHCNYKGGTNMQKHITKKIVAGMLTAAMIDWGIG